MKLHNRLIIVITSQIIATIYNTLLFTISMYYIIYILFPFYYFDALKICIV